MPVVHIYILKGHSLAKKRRMVASVTKALAETLNIPDVWINIVISEMDPSQSAVGGVLIKDLEKKKQPSRKKGISQ